MLGIRSLFQNSLKPEIPEFTAPGSVIDQIPLPRRLRIRYGLEATGFDFSPVGEFPRRVRQGDKLAERDSFPLLAPLSGLVQHDEENKLFELRMEGAFRLGGDVSDAERPMHLIDELNKSGKKEQARAAFLEQLRDSGIPSLDFKSCPLFAQFKKALEHKQPVVIMSYLDPEGAVHWEALSKEGKDGKEELNRLGDFLERTLGNSVKTYRARPAFASARPDAANYGRNLPEVQARRTLRGIRDVASSPSLEEQGIVYLGPATLRALLAFLNEGTPFVERLTAIRFERGVLKHAHKGVKGTVLYRLPNGFALSEILEQLLNRPERCAITRGDIFRHEPLAADADQWAIFDGFNAATYHVTRRVSPTAGDMPCSGCFACENVCPVDASPLSLVEGRTGNFRVDDCLLCGLCDYVCDSRINIRDAVNRRRIQADLPERRVW